MNPTGKKFVSLFLVFSLMMLSVNLYAKERRGVKLVITTLDGQQIEGELITVKPNSLLLLDTEGKDVSIGIEDIEVIRIVKKSTFQTGGKVGLLIGVVIGAISAKDEFEGMEEEKKEWNQFFTLGGFVQVFAGAFLGALIGGIIGAFIKWSKTIHIEGMTDSEIQEALDKLRKKARIRDYK